MQPTPERAASRQAILSQWLQKTETECSDFGLGDERREVGTALRALGASRPH